MTVTQRRVRNDAKSDDRPVTEPGIKYTCDFCHVDITHTVRIKCAMKECEEVDLCPQCFCEGKEGLRHKAWHDYKVVEQHSQPIFSPDWGADEELLLVSGLISNGLGNWLEVAQHVGTRTKEECEKHYLETYLVLMRLSQPMDKSFEVDPDEFQARKKARIEEMRKPHALPPPNAAPLVSAPTNHEVAGFMPGRLEFEHEVDNEAEMAVKDMEFGLVWKYGGDVQPEAKVTKPPDEEEDEEEEDEEEDEKKKKQQSNGDDAQKHSDRVKSDVEHEDESEQPVAGPSSSSPTKEKETPKKDKGKGKAIGPPLPDIEDEDELEVKLAMLDIYFSKLDKRMDAKEILFDRGLTEHKKIQAAERKRPKDEREFIQRYKVFAKFQTAQDFEVLIEGLIYEQNLRKRIAELQEYRRMGITTNAEAEAYDAAKAARAGYRPLVQRDRPDIPVSGARVNAGQHRFLHGGMGTPPPGDPKSREPTPRVIPMNVGRKPPAPLNLANAASLDLLSVEEQSLCSSLRVLPKPYLTIKELYIRENERRHGLLKRRDARRMLKIDVNKSGKIFDYLVHSGILRLKYDPNQPQHPHPHKQLDIINLNEDDNHHFTQNIHINGNGIGLGGVIVDEIRLNGL
uniref:Transcriptional adapter 2 n=1 Tax=Kwoniella pini CBS 10737 TaxID=1296096 RepID=A0A1B9I5Z2_9TREE|nr:transcriptional adapter 2-alpha [Kwoniella pini CBS 10737]OCF50944.1 transcriptional adapter 2-alpha [Kwoniella pini CBS 10737]